nr:zinc-ribbon domain-containing protein [Anaerolineae bacterium]
RCPHCGTPIRPGARFCRTCHRPLTGVPPPLPPSQQPGRFGTGDLLPLTILAGRYVILEKIAQGGMGAVYKAQDRRLQGKIVAVKEMSESAIAPAERKRVLASFQREAELLARLEHPNLARVTDRFQEGERHYMVMEFIEGRTLQDLLEGRTEPFPEEQVLAWAEQLCDVLSFLHSQKPKIIYRDVKPANVMVVDDSDEIKLIDFGIARFFKPGKRKDTIEFGTDGYAPPEQYGKSQTDERADVYALGAMLHQLLTLRDPATDPFRFPRVRSLNPKVSRRVEAAIAKAVKPNKDKRHQSIEEMRVALLGDEATKRRRAPAKKKKKKPARPTRPSAVPPSVPGQLVLTPASLDFGPVLVGGDAPDRSAVVTFPAGERATLSTDVPWLHVHPRSVSKSGKRVTLTLDTVRLKPGRLSLGGTWLKRWAGWHTRLLVPVAQEQHGHVEVQLKSGQSRRAPVSLTAVPQRWQVYAGWTGTVLAMLVEAITALLILATIIGALF